jgi:hypothetical protein
VRRDRQSGHLSSVDGPVRIVDGLVRGENEHAAILALVLTRREQGK